MGPCTSDLPKHSCQGARPADMAHPSISPPMKPSWGRQSKLPGWMVHVQCLLFRLSRQSLLSLLIFRGRPRFRLPCLLSPFLLPAKPSVHIDRETREACWVAAAPSLGTEMSSQEQKRRGELVGDGVGVRGCTLFSDLGTTELHP